MGDKYKQLRVRDLGSKIRSAKNKVMSTGVRNCE